MEPIEAGISSRKFFERLKISKFVNWYKFSGRFSIKFEQRSTHVSDFKWPNDIGKWVSSFLSNISSLSDVRLPKSSGRWVIWLSLIHSKMIHWKVLIHRKIRFTENCDSLQYILKYFESPKILILQKLRPLVKLKFSNNLTIHNVRLPENFDHSKSLIDRNQKIFKLWFTAPLSFIQSGN